jgi:hypothetical protein
MSTTSLENWRELTGELRRRSTTLPDGLRAAAEQLRTVGASPSAALLDELSAYRAQHDAARRLLPDGAAAQPSSLDDLERRLAHRALSAQASPWLDRAERVTAIDAAARECSDRLTVEAGRLRRRLNASQGPGDDELQALAEGRHPLCQAVRLIDEGRVLSDDEWSNVHQTVLASYGAAFAAAAARGRLRVESAGPGHR